MGARSLELGKEIWVQDRILKRFDIQMMLKNHRTLWDEHTVIIHFISARISGISVKFGKL